MANIAFRSGHQLSHAEAKAVNMPEWNSVIKDMEEHVGAHGLKLNGGEIRLSHILTIDPDTEQFVDNHAELGNKFLKREYRKGYEVPDLSLVPAGAS